MTPNDAIALLNKTAELCDQEGAPVCRGMGLREIAQVIQDLEHELFMKKEHFQEAHEQHCRHVAALESKIYNLQDELRANAEQRITWK
jgi:hypothetical protein